MLGMSIYNRKIGKPTLGEAKLLDTLPYVTMFNIVPILALSSPNAAEKTDINQLAKFITGLGPKTGTPYRPPPFSSFLFF